jgi:hypothetical protein
LWGLEKARPHNVDWRALPFAWNPSSGFEIPSGNFGVKVASNWRPKWGKKGRFLGVEDL